MRFQSQQRELDALRAECVRLEQTTGNQLQELTRLHDTDTRCRNLSEQLTALTQTNTELQYRLQHSQQQQTGDMAFSDQLSALQTRLTKLHKEKVAFEAKQKQHESTIAGMSAEVERLRRAYADSERMRAELRVQYDALLQEVAQLRNQAGGDRQTFRDFVQLKRDLLTVTEENEELRTRLKRARSKSNSQKSPSDDATVAVSKLSVTDRPDRRGSKETPTYSKRFM